MQRTSQPPKFLMPGEAAARLGCTPSTLARWCDEIPALRRAAVRHKSKGGWRGHRRYREDVIEAYRSRAS